MRKRHCPRDKRKTPKKGDLEPIWAEYTLGVVIDWEHWFLGHGSFLNGMRRNVVRRIQKQFWFAASASNSAMAARQLTANACRNYSFGIWVSSIGRGGDGGKTGCISNY